VRHALHICVCAALALPVPALAQGGPNILTAPQVAAFELLVSAAKQVDPTFLQSVATEAQKRAELSPLGAVTLNAATTLTVGTATGFDQVAPAFRLSASVDLVKLTQSLTKANTPQLALLTNSTNAAGRDLRVKVLQTYTAYLSAVRAAGVASDTLEVAAAALNQQQARASAGAATGVDVLKSAQSKNQADAAVYDANLRLAVSQQQLAAITGLTLADVNKVLAGSKPRP
jgi:outer membrane protein TolC